MSFQDHRLPDSRLVGYTLAWNRLEGLLISYSSDDSISSNVA